MIPEAFRQWPNRSGHFIWIHAMSLGEVNSSIPLALEFQRRGYRIVYSTGTKSGFTAATRPVKEGGSKIANPVLPMPVDAPWSAKDFIKNLKVFQPVAAVFTETDIWPNMLAFCKKLKIPLVLVNARMRPSSYRYHRIASKLGFRLLDFFDVIFAASRYDALQMAETVSRPEKVRYVGNIKWDAALLSRWSENRIEQLRRQIGLDPGRPVWVAGSVHPGEESIILEVHRKIRRVIPDALLILAPRKLELKEKVANKCYSLGLPCGFRSGSDKVSGLSVYVVDTYGELMGFYALGRCAYVGGSFVPFGGHNVLEPAVYGIPVCWGPHIFNFKEITEELHDRSIGSLTPDAEDLFLWVRDRLQQTERTEMCPIPSPAREIVDFIHQILESIKPG
nr:glycosyltransferase N-terminal domain-containing protein [Thermodesulforhabdus norvegica]